jgi:chemotaxis protein methyltransferase CheR
MARRRLRRAPPKICNDAEFCSCVFAEVQLVSCRNVLIYFNRELLDRAIGLFRDALCRKGFLGIGVKESLRCSSHAQAFTDVSYQHRIFQKTDAS